MSCCEKVAENESSEDERPLKYWRGAFVARLVAEAVYRVYRIDVVGARDLEVDSGCILGIPRTSSILLGLFVYLRKDMRTIGPGEGMT